MTVTRCHAADGDLVAAIRQGDDSAFEELYSRYRAPITSFVRGMLRDEARAEDVTQEAFLSALRRIRETQGEITFRPWIYEIARNAAIDSYRRSSRAVEISMDTETGLRASDRTRLADGALPESALIAKERLDHLRGAFDELPDVQARVLVMRDVDGLSYREIGERLDMGRPAVERTLTGARHRLESEYAQLSEGRRCAATRGAIVRLAEAGGSRGDERRLARHAKRCSQCRRLAREFGVEPLAAPSLRSRIAALLPLPWSFSAGGPGSLSGLASERAAAVLATVAIAGAGGAALEMSRDDGGNPPGRETQPSPAVKQSAEPATRSARPAGRSVERRSSTPRRRAAARRRAERRRAERQTAGGGSATDAAVGAQPQAAAPPAPGARNPGVALPKVEAPAVPPAPSLPLPQVGSPAPGEVVPPVTLPEPLPPVVNETVEKARDVVNGVLP